MAKASSYHWLFSCTSLEIVRYHVFLYAVYFFGVLVERFNYLLQNLGDVPVKIYEREVYELRYPKYLHEIFQEMSYEKDLDAMIDEVGEFKENKVVLRGEEIEPRKLEKVYHKEKRLKLALIREDNKEIAKLMTEEKEKVRKALNQI